MLLDFIEHGQQGLNRGLPIGLDDPRDAMIGVLPSHYYLVGADSGVGKTTFADYNFLLTPYFEKPDDVDVQWFYYSLEIGAAMKKAAWLNYIIHREEGVTIPVTDLAGFKGTKLTSEQMRLIRKYSPMVEQLAKDIRLHDDDINPTGIYFDLLDFAEKNGKFIYETKNIKGQQTEVRKDYIPNDPNQRVIVIIDHLALLSSEKGKKKKELMDLMSEYAKFFRNKCGYTFVIIQQFNTSLENNSRSQSRNEQRIVPTRLDFGDSTYTYRDADIVIGGVCPAKFEYTSYRNYNIALFGESLTFWFVIKNRWIGRLTNYPLVRQRDLPIMLSPDVNNSSNSNSSF